MDIFPDLAGRRVDSRDESVGVAPSGRRCCIRSAQRRPARSAGKHSTNADC